MRSDIYGVCCECQTAHKVITVWVNDDKFVWVVEPHEFYGQWCEGSEMEPQTIYKKLDSG